MLSPAVCETEQGSPKILIFTSAFSPLPYIVSVKVYEQNPASHKYVVGKGGNILIAFRIIMDVLLRYFFDK